MALSAVLLLIAVATSELVSVDAFTTQAIRSKWTPQRTQPRRDDIRMMLMMDPSEIIVASTAAAPWIETGASNTVSTSQSVFFTSGNLLAFSDQGQNLAGIFFQASLLPYLLFLYFLSFRANRISALGNFGFQFVLLFVLSTIPSGIITKSVYGQSLANTDWAHGGAELLLTIANVFVVSLH